MKLCTLILALTLFLLLTSSGAIRILRDPNPVEIQVNNDEKISSINGGVKTCEDDKEDWSPTSSSGKFRKLMMSTNSSSSTPPTIGTYSKRPEANNVDPTVVKESSYGVDDNRKTEPSSESETAQATSQDIEDGDIAEMDYSPAKRKPPIHN